MKNIYLVGFMGTGKSSVGKVLADRLKAVFLDTDTLIEQQESRQIKEIFADQGEAYFRQLEHEVLLELSRQQGLVVSCGGGIVIAPENIRLMKQSGHMICLSADVDSILARTRSCVDRPLLQTSDPKARIEQLLVQRQPLYAQADHCIDTSCLSIPEVSAAIEVFLKTFSAASAKTIEKPRH